MCAHCNCWRGLYRVRCRDARGFFAPAFPPDFPPERRRAFSEDEAAGETSKRRYGPEKEIRVSSEP
jgi:hypothetical protein